MRNFKFETIESDGVMYSIPNDYDNIILPLNNKHWFTDILEAGIDRIASSVTHETIHLIIDRKIDAETSLALDKISLPYLDRKTNNGID